MYYIEPHDYNSFLLTDPVSTGHSALPDFSEVMMPSLFGSNGVFSFIFCICLCFYLISQYDELGKDFAELIAAQAFKQTPDEN